MQPLDRCLTESDRASDAIQYLRETQDDCIAVTSSAEPHVFQGVVRRSAITALLIQERKSTQPARGDATVRADTV